MFTSMLSRFEISYLHCRSCSTSASKQYGTLAKAAKALQSAKLPKVAQSEAEAAAEDSVQPVSKRERVHQRKRVEMMPNIWAYATAEQYDLSAFKRHVTTSLADRYKLEPVGSELNQKVIRLVDFNGQNDNCDLPADVIACDLNVNDATSLKRFGQKGGEVLLFKEGVTVMWDMNDKDRRTLLKLVEQFQIAPIDKRLTNAEVEKLTYVFNDQIDRSQFSKNEILNVKAPQQSNAMNEAEDFLEKYAISDAMCRSVKLAMRECHLETLVDTLNPIVADLKQGHISVQKGDLLKKTGELFSLRHDISLDSDLLDETPDFYWDREQLEKLYKQASEVLCISRRTKVMNEKLNYCMQLGERLDGHLNATHSVRLERIIIFLIAIEVAFEMLHFVV